MKRLRGEPKPSGQDAPFPGVECVGAALELPRSPVPAAGGRILLTGWFRAESENPICRIVARIGGREFSEEVPEDPEGPEGRTRRFSVEIALPWGYRRLNAWGVHRDGSRRRLGRRWVLRLGPGWFNQRLVGIAEGIGNLLREGFGLMRMRWALRPRGPWIVRGGALRLEGWFWHPAGPAVEVSVHSFWRRVGLLEPAVIPAGEGEALRWLPPGRFWGFGGEVALPAGGHWISVWARLPSGWRIPLRLARVVSEGPREKPPRSALLEARSTRIVRIPVGSRGIGEPFGREPGKVLVLALDHIGDLVQSLPALDLLRERLPKAEIVVGVGPWGLPILERHRIADRVVPIRFFREEAGEDRRAAEARGLLSPLQGEAFALAIDLRLGRDTRPLLRSVSTRATAGYGEEAESWLSFRMPIPPALRRVPCRDEGLPLAEQKLALVAALPLKLPVSGAERPLPSFTLRPPRQDIWEEIERLPGEEIVLLHAASGKRATQWPAERFARVADRLVERFGARLVFCGSPGEREGLAALADSLRHREHALVLAGRVSLGEFFDLLPRFDFFLGNDSGPAHLAAILGLPTLVLFGGSGAAWEFHPLGPACFTLRLPLPCSPCFLPASACPWNLRCLEGLCEEEVFAAVERVWAESRAAGNASREEKESAVSRVSADCARPTEKGSLGGF